MNTSTPITTAARRITREVNATVAEITVYFDADGHHVNAHESGMWYADPADIPAHAVSFPGSKNRPEKLTQRQAQDHLDAAAHFASRPSDPFAYDMYLAELDLARRLSA